MFRNAADLIGLVILHHLLTMADRVYCLDNGSTDDGAARIASLARRSGRIELMSDATIRPKREYLNDLARRAHADGFDVIVCFDSDELWHGSRDQLCRAFAMGHNVLRCPVLNFIQRRGVERPSWFSWRHAVRRCLSLETVPSRVTSGDISFMEYEFPSKVIFLSDRAAEVHRGQHGVDRPDHHETTSDSIAVLHLPMRAKSEIVKRACDYEPRRATLRTAPHDAWQGLYWRTRVDEGHLDDEWRALSYGERGELEVKHRRVATITDRRLVFHLYRAALTTRYGCAGLRC